MILGEGWSSRYVLLYEAVGGDGHLFGSRQWLRSARGNLPLQVISLQLTSETIHSTTNCFISKDCGCFIIHFHELFLACVFPTEWPFFLPKTSSWSCWPRFKSFTSVLQRNTLNCWVLNITHETEVTLDHTPTLETGSSLKWTQCILMCVDRFDYHVMMWYYCSCIHSFKSPCGIILYLVLLLFIERV